MIPLAAPAAPSRPLIDPKSARPWLAPLALSLAVWAPYIALSRIPYFPFNDDWTYISSVEKTLQAGALRLSQGGAPTAYVQILWGALFARFFGLSFQVLIFSTWTMVWLGLLAFYRDSRSLAASLALLFNPLFFHLGYSFMTDAFALALMLLSGHAFLLGLSDDRREAWLWAGSALAAAAFLVRQTGAAMAAAAAIWLLFQGERRLRRYLAVLGVVGAAVAAHTAWIGTHGRTFGFAYASHATLWSMPGAPGAIPALIERLCGAGLYVGMALLPWVFVGGRLRRAGAVACGALALLGLAAWFGHLVPSTGNIIGRYGLGGCPFLTSCDFKPTGVLGSGWFWRTATACFLFSCFLAAWRSDFSRKFLSDPRAAYLLGFVLAFLASLAAGTYYDRYFLALIPAAIFAASQAWKPRWWTMVPALLVLTTWSVFGTWDLLAVNEARWKAGEVLLKDTPAWQISNGLDWESYYTFDDRLRELTRTRRIDELTWTEVWPTAYSAFVSFAPRSLDARLERIGEVSYRTPLTFRTERLYLWRVRR